MVAHLNVPPLSPPKPLPPEDPGAAPKSDPPSSQGLSDPEAQPELCYADPEEIQEDLLHRVLAVNALTRHQKIRKEPILAPEARETVALPYADQLALPSAPVTHESDSAKKLAKLLKSVNVSAPLDALKELSPALGSALEEFLAKYKDLDVLRIMSLSTEDNGGTHCTYIDMVVNKVKVRAIIDSGAPNNIVSSRLVKRLKLAPDLDYQEEFGTAGPATTKAMGAFTSLPLRFGKLIVTAPAIVLNNNSYDILIGTGFMVKYGTLTDHGSHTFTILGQAIPMYYRGTKAVDLPKRKLHFINMEYADGDVPIAYTLRQRRLKVLPLSSRESKGIPLYAAASFSIPPGSQTIHQTGLSLELPIGMHGEVFGRSNASRLEPWICPGIVMQSPDEISVLLANLGPAPLVVKKNQLLGFLRLEENASLAEATPIAGINELGLPSPPNQVLSAIPRDSLLGLSEQEKDQAMNLFDQYKEVFAKDDYDLGKAVGVEHTLDTQGHDPIRSRPIRRSQANHAIADEELQKLLGAGLIVPSRSPWASPLLIVKKKDGSNRVVIDYRRLNSITKKDSYPLPRIDDTLDRLGGAQYFSAMDLISGYWQIDLPPEDQEKCAIITEKGLFQPTCMPQGLTNAPATFQRAMDAVMGDLKLTSVLVYLDDINVFSRTFQDHLQHLEEVFKRLLKANLKLKPRKCSFFKEHLEFLGFTISKDGLRPVAAKVEAIKKMQVPANKRDIQVFLGMIGYYRRFISNFAALGDPLFNLLRADVEFFWSDACQTAFNALKDTLLCAPVLAYPDFDRPFVVHTDASLTAIGGVLSQLDTDGHEHPVGYCSRTLNSHKCNYTVIKRECLAVIYAYQQFRVYLHGVHFTVVTDHASLQWLKTLKDPEGRLARWAIKLQAFDYDIQHRAGAIHQNADCLSRLPTIALLSPVADELYDKLLMDPSLWGEEPTEIQSVLKKLSVDTKVKNGQLLKLYKGNWLPYIRPSLRTDSVVAAHKAIGHGGVQKTLAQLQQHCYWEGMTSDVAEVLAACHDCNVEKPKISRYQHKLVRPGFAFHTVAIDVVGPLPASKSKNRFIIVAIDQLTKWVEAKAIPNQSALTTAMFILEQIVYRHGCPQMLLTDNGSNFTSHMIPRLNQLMGIRGTLSTPYHPQTNGMVERTNGSLVQILRKLSHQHETEWDTFLPAATFAYNIGYHRGTGKTPFQLLYGRQPGLPPLLYSLVQPTQAISPDAYLHKLAQTLIKIQAEAYTVNLNGKTKDVDRASASRPALPQYHVGDSVYFYSNRGYGRESKLASLWQGPVKVIQKVGPDSYTLKEPTSGHLITRVHAQYMRAAPSDQE